MMNMKMTAAFEGRTVACRVFPAEKKYISVVGVPCALEAETIPYAACRLFAHSIALQNAFVPQSYHLRFCKGKRRKRSAFCYTLEVPASCFSLSSHVRVYISITVTAEGVRIDRVQLLPAGATPQVQGRHMFYSAAHSEGRSTVAKPHHKQRNAS